MAQSLTTQQVRHVAKLARLRLDDAAVERYRGELSSVLEHVATLGALDMRGVEPLASPHDTVNRFADDAVEASFPQEVVQRNAPAVEGLFLAVPKVLDDDAGGREA